MCLLKITICKTCNTHLSKEVVYCMKPPDGMVCARGDTFQTMGRDYISEKNLNKMSEWNQYMWTDEIKSKNECEDCYSKTGETENLIEL